MTKVTQQEYEFPPQASFVTYVRSIIMDGEEKWALFSGDGEMIFFHAYRSAPYFHAAEIERPVVLLH